MRHRVRLGLCAGMLLVFALALPSGAAAASGVAVRVEGARSTLLSKTVVSTRGPAVVKDGNRAHACPGSSALGALDRALRGRWNGAWVAGLGYFVDTLVGETHRGRPDFWAFWINNRQAQSGLCQTRVRAHDHILLLVDRGGVRPTEPLAVRSTARARVGRPFIATVVAYDVNGAARPIAGARLSGTMPGVSGRTDRRGRLRLRAPKAGRLALSATRGGFVRSDARLVRVSR